MDIPNGFPFFILSSKKIYYKGQKPEIYFQTRIIPRNMIFVQTKMTGKYFSITPGAIYIKEKNIHGIPRGGGIIYPKEKIIILYQSDQKLCIWTLSRIIPERVKYLFPRPVETGDVFLQTGTCFFSSRLSKEVTLLGIYSNVSNPPPLDNSLHNQKIWEIFSEWYRYSVWILYKKEILYLSDYGVNYLCFFDKGLHLIRAKISEEAYLKATN